MHVKKITILIISSLLMALLFAGCTFSEDFDIEETENPTEPKPSSTPSLHYGIYFSHEAGFYEHEFELELSAPSGSTIYYTTDGSDPRIRGKEYTEPIKISNSDTKPIGRVTRSIGSYGTKPRLTATVVRAYAKKNSFESPVVTNTYFVAENLAERYKLPFINVSLEYSDFAGSRGIYFKPSISDNVFDTKQRIKVFVELFDEKGLKRDNMYAEMSLQGNGSMGASMKSFRLFFKKDLDKDSLFYPSKLTYDLFGGRVKDKGGNTINTFKRILLRNSGNDFNCSMLRDRLIQKLSEPLTCDYQESQPVMMFINGEFWGMYNARERYDDKYFRDHYGILEENLVMLEAPTPLKFPDRSYTNPYELCEGEKGDDKPWHDLIRYIDTHNLANDNYYKVVEEQVDIYSLMDMYIVNVFFCNADWPGNNVKVWRNKNPNDPSGMDTKWRFVLMDLDMGAGYAAGPEHNFMGHAFNRGTGWILTKLMTSLLQNEGFKQEFVERFVYVVDNVFTPEITIPVLESMADEIEAAMELNVARWPQNNMNNWKAEIQKIRSFLNNRGKHVKNHVYSFFGIQPKEVSYVFDKNKVSLDVNGRNVPEGYTTEIEASGKLNLSVTTKNGYEFVAINVIDAYGNQKTYNDDKATISLSGRTTVVVLAKMKNFRADVQIAAGSRTMFAITENGDLYAWGSNELGQLGVATSKTLTKPTLIMTGVVKIATSMGGNAGDSPHTLILTDNNVLYTVGNNSFGQLGRTGDTTIPMKVEFTGKIKDISAGHDHSLVLLENGDLYGCGNNERGQLGSTNFGGQINHFVKIASNVKEIAAGRRHTVFVDKQGRAYALGDNRWNKLTTQSVESYTSPVLLMDNVRKVYAGEHQTLLITNNNELYYLGWRNHVSLAAGQADGKPHKLMDNVKKASMMDEHAIILTYDNKAYGWGLNSYSQVTGGTKTQSKPVLIANNVIDVAAGSWFSALLHDDGRIVVWGNNNSGIAGNGIISTE